MVQNQPKYLVLAGNMREFVNWLNDNDVARDEAMCVTNSYQLRGRRFIEGETKVVRTYSFWDRKDCDEISEIVATRFF